MDSTICFNSVSKRYQIGTLPSLREAVTNSVRRMTRKDNDAGDSLDLWALRDINLEVRPGETLGVIGPNGAGKSTLLKLIARVTQPSQGQVRVRGRVSSLIELGAGFHPDLTGRENIYLNAAILGLSRKTVGGLFDQIVSFAELERFIDTPVKRYSSGMYARLGFAVAAHVDADVLLVDEVLSVGDYSFQHKCFAAIDRLRQNAKSIVFVSHNMPAVQSLCDRAIMLRQGRIVAQGTPDTTIQAYELQFAAANNESFGSVEAPESGAPFSITHVSVHGSADGPEADELPYGSAAVVRIAYHARQPVERPLFHFVVQRLDGTPCCGGNAGSDGFIPAVVTGPGVAEVSMPELSLPPSQYFVTAFVSNYLHSVDYARAVSRVFRVASQPFLDTRIGGYVVHGDWQFVPGGQ
jgi:lipopolysaccharide transport system ATP-binding protein